MVLGTLSMHPPAEEFDSTKDENAVPMALKNIKNPLMAKSTTTVQLPRRSALGDVSNVAINPPVVPARNLRTSTLQAKLAVRAKTSHIDEAISKTSAFGEGEKENLAPAPATFISKALSRVPLKPHWDDLDAEDAGDPLMVSEYVVEIFDYMKKLEKQIMPSPTYIDQQKELNWNMRSVLIDWLIEVQWKLKLLPETLFLSVNIMDRFLSRRVVSLVKLQLVGLAATLLASKFEEVLSPAVSNFIYLSDNAYETEELLKAERYMLHVLNFNLSYPNPLVFLRRISKADGYDVRSRTLAKYFMECALLDNRFLSCPPSMLAAMGLYLAREMIKSGPWNNNLVHYSGDYSEADIRPWADLLLDYLKQPTKNEAIYKKYSSKKLMKASIFVQEYMRKTFDMESTACP